MRRLLPHFLLAVCGAAAGFCLTRFWPAESAAPVAAVVRPQAERLPWVGRQGAARLAAFMDHASGMEAAAWPDLFARYGQDELLRSALMDAWAAADPAGFWQWIVNKKDASLLQEAGPRLFTAWAKKDAAAAFAATGLIASHTLRDPLRTLVVESALARDLKAGLALAAQFGPLFTNGYINRALLERDPLGFVQGLTTLPGGAQSFRRFYLRAACRILAKQNPEAFLTWLESRPRDAESLLDNDTFTEGAPMDATRAIAVVAAMKPGSARREAMRGAIVSGGAQLPAEEILRLAREHLTGWERNSTVGDAVKTAAKSDLPKAAALLSAMPAGRYVISAAAEVAGTWAKADWPAAQAWVQNLPDAPVRREAWRAVSSALPPERVPAFAASLATLPPEELSDGLLLNVRKALSKTGPDAVENWLQSLPPDRREWVQEMQNIQ